MEGTAARLHRTRWPVFLLIALLGLAVRLPQLGARPMHTDEAVNAYIVGQLLAGEPYHYDPQDRHGPALSALAFPLAKLQGAHSFSALTESQLRLTPVIAGTITILLFGAASPLFGFLPSVLAALLFAFAPLSVYYDRYFIHESLFCAAAFGLILSAWCAWKVPSNGHAALAGACAALMFACKETAVLHFAALAAAALILRFRAVHPDSSPARSRIRPLLTAAATFLALLVILFSWFGRNWKAFPTLLHFVPHTLARAAGQGHEKPFWYYGSLLSSGWSGALLLALACLGLLLTLRKREPSPFALLSYYTLLITAIYSLIPYKTPWLALNLWLPISLFAAKAIQSLWRSARTKIPARAAIPLFCLVAAASAVLIAHDIRARVFLHPADESNPYAYAHTTDDITGLPSEIADMARRDGITHPRIFVIAADPWPLPWYLRHFEHVGFWQPGQQVPKADFYVTSTDAANQYSAQLQNFRPDFFGVRPNVLILLWFPEPK